MTLGEQCAVMIEAGEAGFVKPADIVKWADSMIVEMEKPPDWIIQLSTLNSTYLADYTLLLRKNTTVQLSIRQRIQWIIRGYRSGHFSLDEMLQKCFEIVVYEERKDLLSECDNRLVELLVEWDIRDFVVDERFQKSFEKIFDEYMADAENIERIFLWQAKEAK